MKCPWSVWNIIQLTNDKDHWCGCSPAVWESFALTTLWSKTAKPLANNRKKTYRCTILTYLHLIFLVKLFFSTNSFCFNTLNNSFYSLLCEKDAFFIFQYWVPKPKCQQTPDYIISKINHKISWVAFCWYNIFTTTTSMVESRVWHQRTMTFYYLYYKYSNLYNQMCSC